MINKDLPPPIYQERIIKVCNNMVVIKDSNVPMFARKDYLYEQLCRIAIDFNEKISKVEYDYMNVAMNYSTIINKMDRSNND